MKIVDDTMRDALFLANHPGWTWQAMMDTPEDVLESLIYLEAEA